MLGYSVIFGTTLFEDFVRKDKLHNVWKDTFQNVINNIFETKSIIFTLKWFSISIILQGFHRYTWDYGFCGKRVRMGIAWILRGFEVGYYLHILYLIHLNINNLILLLDWITYMSHDCLVLMNEISQKILWRSDTGMF